MRRGEGSRPVSLHEQAGKGGLSRRTVLRGAVRGALVAMALPPLEIFFDAGGKAYACGGSIPRRFGLFYWGNGNLPDRWTPTGVGDDWELSEQLAPLARVKDQLTVVSGLAVHFPNTLPHLPGVAGMLTGSPLQAVGSDHTVSAPSIDQLIARAIGGETAFRSLQTAATDIRGLSYTGPSSLCPAEVSPHALYQRLFGPEFREPGESGEVDPSLRPRRSALDAVLADAAALRGRLGKADQARLDQHLEGVYELEHRLEALEADPPDLEACSRPMEPLLDYPAETGRPQISARSRAMVDVLTMALACDLTRVFSHYIDEPMDDCLFPDATSGHHSLTHDEPRPQLEVNAITIACVEELAYLLESLAGVDEGDGTLLDNCAVLACSEVSEGRTHQLTEMPIVVAGGACGRLKQGLHHRSYDEENVSKLLLSMLRVMDVPADEFGEAEGYVDESLTEIED